MKRIINKMMKDRHFCGLDIGSQKLKVGILKVDDQGVPELVGAYENRIHGFRDSSVSDLAELTECVHNTLGELSRRTGIKLKEIQLGIGGDLIDTRKTNTAIPLVDRGSKVIANRDVKKINHQAKLLGAKMEEEILHHLPQFYKVDDVNSALNPLGLYGHKLAVQSLMIISNETKVRNIFKAINQAGYEVSNLFFSSYVSADNILSDEDKKEGCVLVDIGSKVTSLLFFKEKVLQYVGKVDIAGDNFTRSIASKLNLPFDLAEEIKKSYASAIETDVGEDEEILVKRESSYVPIKRHMIFEAIEPVIKKLSKEIQKIIEESNLKDQINKGLVITGGGALLPGIIECIGRATHVSVKLGKINIMTQKNISNVALFSPVIGLAQNGMKDSFSFNVTSNGNGHWLTGFKNRMLEIYHEYF